jgi:RNA polymerase sigma factor (sigma-70 family)
MLNSDDFQRTAVPHMPVLHKYALHLTMDSEDAKDLVQDTCLKAYKFREQFEEGTNIKAWLFRIMKNSFLNRYRKEKGRPTKVRYEESHLPHNITEETYVVHIPEREASYDHVFGDEIMSSIESINDLFKNVIFLSDVEGLTYEEIAAAVDCPLGTVRSRLHRGRNLLKKKLSAYARGNGYISGKS